METEAKANSRRCFWGENGRPLTVDSLADELIKASITGTHVLIKAVVLLTFLILSGRSVVASWAFTLKEAGSNLLEIFKFFP